MLHVNFAVRFDQSATAGPVAFFWCSLGAALRCSESLGNPVIYHARVPADCALSDLDWRRELTGRNIPVEACSTPSDPSKYGGEAFDGEAIF